jgi:CheY-like chemotaxis protein
MQTVLVVEDSPPIAALEADLVLASGRQALVAPDGAAALALLEDTDVDLILLDLNLPLLSGQAVLDRLTDDPRLGGIPVIVVSGSLTDLHATPQVVAVFDKPFDLREMETTIDRIVPAAVPTAGWGRDRASLG